MLSSKFCARTHTGVGTNNAFKHTYVFIGMVTANVYIQARLCGNGLVYFVVLQQVMFTDRHIDANVYESDTHIYIHICVVYYLLKDDHSSAVSHFVSHYSAAFSCLNLCMIDEQVLIQNLLALHVLHGYCVLSLLLFVAML